MSITYRRVISVYPCSRRGAGWGDTEQWWLTALELQPRRVLSLRERRVQSSLFDHTSTVTHTRLPVKQKVTHICQRYDYLPYFLEVSAPLFWADVTLNWICYGDSVRWMSLTGYRWSTHCVSLSAAWLRFTPALGLTTGRADEITEAQSEEEHLDTWDILYISHLLCHCHFTSRPTNPCRWICNDEGWREKTKISLSLIRHYHYHHYRSGRSGSWCLVLDSRGTCITHNSRLVVKRRTATQTTHFPFTMLKDSRLYACPFLCVCVCIFQLT